MARNYENFDIEVIREQDTYAVRIRSPRGEARAVFASPLTAQEVRILALTVARGRKTSRSVQTREVDEVKAYGQRLFDSLFTGDVLACYHESLSQVRSNSGTGLRVRLRLSDAPELAQVPWEYIFDRRNGRFLALEDETPIVRYLDLPLASGVLQVDSPLRVLVMISSPSDVPGLNVEEEWKRLNQALGDLVGQDVVRLDRLDKATIGALRWRLKEEEYHVFHFIGHGGVDAQTDRGVLILEDAGGRSDVVEAETIAGILSGEKSLRLAVLNACEGGRASKGDIFAGTAQTLVQQDVPAVIAMQFEISDEAAITLTHDFYKSLAYGDPVDAALTEARRGLRFEHRNELEWGTPVLYMRASDGRLFDVKASQRASAPPEQQAEKKKPQQASAPEESEQAREGRTRGRQIDAMVHLARVDCAAENWEAAIAKLEAALQLDPAHPEAANLMKDVCRRQQTDVLYRTGVAHESAGRVGEAIEAFQQARQLAGADYRAVDARIKSLKGRVKGEPPRRESALWGRIGKFAAGFVVLVIVVVVIVNGDSSSSSDISTDAAPFDPSVNPTPDPIKGSEPAPSPPAPASADNEIPNRDAEAASQGLSPYGPAVFGMLAQGGSIVHPVTLEGGATYVIAGSCDAACGDLDLAISEQGVTKFQDTGPDKIPAFPAPVILTGTYQLTVTMPSCSSSQCGYRLQVYR